jgi:hypothetical protein
MSTGIRLLVRDVLMSSFPSIGERLGGIIDLPQLGEWERKHKPKSFASREDLWKSIASLHDGPIHYLEFGVASGYSIDSWSKLNKNPKTQLVGFDSFIGLPEDWITPGNNGKRGAFSTNGKTPNIADPRVSFRAGWFQDSLPSFLATFRPAFPLVVHCDADLYSSTLFVLCSLNHCLEAGAIIIFDEFAAVRHEFRALNDYTQSFQRSYDVIGATFHLEQAAIRLKC